MAVLDPFAEVNVTYILPRPADCCHPTAASLTGANLADRNLTREAAFMGFVDSSPSVSPNAVSTLPESRLALAVFADMLCRPPSGASAARRARHLG